MATIEQLLTEAAREETEARTIAAVVAMLRAYQGGVESTLSVGVLGLVSAIERGDWRAYLPKGGEGE
jgi:hypothetical protein